MTIPHPTREHPDSDSIAAFAERRLTPAERATVERHLAECAECRADLLAVSEMLVAARRRRRLFVAGPLVTAAAVAMVLLLQRVGPAPDESRLLRPGTSTEQEQLNTLEAILPAPGATVSRQEGILLVWESDGPDAVYEVALADSSGAALWRTRTPDTSIALPDTVRLVPGAVYHWWVDVLLRDGRMATTGVREFSFRP